MGAPKYGALGATFTVVRALQAVCLVAIIGMAANFIAMMTCIAVLYCAITYILYFDCMLPFLISTGLDSALLIALIVVSVTVGKPLSYLNCAALSKNGGNTKAFVKSVGENMGKVNYFVWAGGDSTTCFEVKSIWGLSIALCILFSFSSIVSVCLWKRQKSFGTPKSIEG